MLLIFLCILPTYLAQGQVIQLCDESCLVEKELDLTEPNKTVRFEACEGDLIKLQFRPEESVNVDISLNDEFGQQIFATHGFKKSEDVVVYSLRNNATLNYLFFVLTPSTQFPTSSTASTSTTTTVNPDSICTDVCLSQSQEGLYPFPDSCCIDGGLYCNCDQCFSGMCVGQSARCVEGEGFCDETNKCTPMSQCQPDLCCPTIPPFLHKNDPQHTDTSDSRLFIRYSCQKNTEKSGSFNVSDQLTEVLEPNMVLNYNLISDLLQQVEVNMSVPSPLAGFSAVGIGEGKYAFSYGNLNLAILNTESDTTEVKVVTINTPMEGSTMDFSYDLGEQTTSTTTTTPIPRTTAATDDKTATVYVLAINEENFVNESFKNENSDFKIRTWKIMTDACPDLLDSQNLIHYNAAYSCRKKCYMTNNPDRGCAMLGMHLENIPESTHCPGIVGSSRIQFFREQLQDQRKEMKKRYKAKRVDIDSCTEINWTTEWLWVAIGLVVGAVLLSGAIVFIKKQGGRLRKGDREHLINEMEPEKPIPISRSNGWEIIDENDEY